MLEDEKYLNKDETNLRIARLLVWGALGVFLIFFTSVSGCVMYSNSVEAEQTRAKTERLGEKRKIRKDELDAISALIDKGTNPIAARCAIMGYYSRASNPCLIYAIEKHKEIELK